MSLILEPTQGVAPGLTFANQDATMRLASGLTCAKGDILAVDMDTVDSTRLVNNEVREPVTADFVTASGGAFLRTFFCVALETQTTAAGIVRCRFVGEVDAKIASTSVAVGEYLSPTNTSRALTESTGAAGSGTCNVALARVANTTANAVVRVLFNGINGFGTHLTNTT